MIEGNKILCKICQTNLFCDDLIKSREKLEQELKRYMDTFKLPYDSFFTYAQIVESYQHQLAKLEVESTKWSKKL